MEPTGSTDTVGESMYLPQPVEPRTQSASGPLITLAPDPGEKTVGSSPERRDLGAGAKLTEDQISLSAGQTARGAPMEKIDLTGVYPGGEGSILQVEQWTDGSVGVQFPVTASVSNETFSTYIPRETSQAGTQPVPRRRHGHPAGVQRSARHHPADRLATPAWSFDAPAPLRQAGAGLQSRRAGRSDRRCWAAAAAVGRLPARCLAAGWRTWPTPGV